ncbi:MAG: hypothetical protein PHQ98_04740 [Candidatus ainarchaeum sp.]|nr:hypothetical protein [Candidatus ainarchaeum sp.]
MKNIFKFLTIFSLIFATIFLLGCTNVSDMSICGDNICTAGEELTCVSDCAKDINGTVYVRINGAYDADGDLSLRWSHSKDVSLNANAAISSYLGEHWNSVQNKNLYLNFNDSKSGEIPIVDWEDRDIKLPNLEQGDYYFEVYSEDYAYRAVSEKITIKNDKDYYVNLTLVPSNPAVRVKAIDGENGSILNGPAKVTLYAISNYYNGYGEYVEDKWEYNSRYFYNGDEINELFFVYNGNYYLDNYSIRYEILIEKDGYGSQTIYYSPYDKYQEYNVYLEKESNKIGNLNIEIIPGQGTTNNDIQSFVGQNMTICGNECYDATIMNDQNVVYAKVENIPFGNYSVSSHVSRADNVPISFSAYSINVDNSSSNSVQVEAVLGSYTKLSFFNQDGNLITDYENVVLTKVCSVGNDMNNCSDVNYQMSQNPIDIINYLSKDTIDYYSSVKYTYDCMYKGIKSKFELSYPQGYKETNVNFKK